MGYLVAPKTLQFFLVLTCLFLRYCKSDVDPELKNKMDTAVSNVGFATSIAKKMLSDDITKSFLAGGPKQIEEKVKKVKAKFSEAVKQSYKKDPEGNAERIAGAVTGIGEAVGPIINSIKNKDWKGGVQSVLGLISSVAALAGPTGMVVSAILSFVSSLFDLFGGGEAEESMDSKIERIVSEQIGIARKKDLEEAVQGFKIAYGSLSTSVRQFRTSGELDEDQARELYGHAFVELPIFGKLKGRVDELCDDVKIYKDATKCLAVLTMYAEVAVVRQFLLTELAALIADVHERKYGVYREGITGETSGLLAVSNNIIDLITTEQRKDRAYLSFMTDPFNHPSRRYIIGVFFANPAKYLSLQFYIRSFKNEDNSNVFRDYVMICKEQVLQGSCFMLKKGWNPDLSHYPKGWNKTIRSFYLPLGLQMNAWYGTGERGMKYGPFAGPTAHTNMSADKIWQSIKILGTIRDADKEVKFCQEVNMDLGICDTANPGKYNLDRYHGYVWEKKVRSMYIPAGLNVKGFTDLNEGGKAYVMYVGPFKVNRLWDENSWKSMTVDTTDGDAREKVQVCDEPNLQGHCVITGISSNQLNHLGGSNFENKVKSLKIPGGVHVTGFTEHNKEGTDIGPYRGPTVIGNVDEGSTWKSMLVAQFGKRK